MRLLHRVLAILPHTNKPQRKFIAPLLGLRLMLPGHAPCRQLSRYRASHERTFARGDDRAFDFGALNKAAMTPVVPPEHPPALVIDASFIPNRGPPTDGLDRFWNRHPQRREKGRAISAVAGLDLTDRCA